jgi:hypothetical protein
MATDHAHGHDQHDIRATNLTPDDKKFLQRHADELSDSTLRAKWINKPGEKADRDGQTLATRDRDVIEQWAEARGGKPATVAGTEHGGRPGVLRIDFQDRGDDDTNRIQDISWDDWFRTFDARELVFIFQDRKSDGSQSNFFRLDSPTRDDA